MFKRVHTREGVWDSSEAREGLPDEIFLYLKLATGLFSPRGGDGVASDKF